MAPGPEEIGTPEAKRVATVRGLGTVGVQVRGKDKGGSERDEQGSDAWWAMLAGKLLHPAQVASIEVFSYIGLPICVADLAEIIDDIEPVNLDYHLGRLRKIGALEVVGSPSASKGFMEVRYRLTEERFLGGGR